MVGEGLAASMAQPAAYTTGVSILGTELDLKRLELLHEFIPQARRIAILKDPTSKTENQHRLESAAARLDLELVLFIVHNTGEVDRALEKLAAAKVGAVNVLASPMLNGARRLIIDKLRDARLPSIWEWPETAAEGGLLGYGTPIGLLYRRVAVLADKILRGAPPCRFAHRTADQVRVGRQLANSERDWPHTLTNAVVARRPGDRMKRREASRSSVARRLRGRWRRGRSRLERARRVGVLMNLRRQTIRRRWRGSRHSCRGLQELGWTDGRNLRASKPAGPQADPERLRRHASELAALRAGHHPGHHRIATVRRARCRSTAHHSDRLRARPPIRSASGFVASLARPGGNVTGFSRLSS